MSDVVQGTTIQVVRSDEREAWRPEQAVTVARITVPKSAKVMRRSPLVSRPAMPRRFVGVSLLMRCVRGGGP